MLQQNKSLRITATLYLLAMMFPVAFFLAGNILSDSNNDNRIIEKAGALEGALEMLVSADPRDDHAKSVEYIDTLLGNIEETFIVLDQNKGVAQLQSPEVVFFELTASWSAFKKALLKHQTPQSKVVQSCLKQSYRLAAGITAVTELKKERMLYALYGVLLAGMMLILLLIYFVKSHLKQQAEANIFKDPVTHLYNKSYFFDELENATARAKRHEEVLSIILFSIDGFDGFSLDKRDALVMALGEQLRLLTRTSDVCCRVGENEYAVIAPKTEAANVQIPLERIRKVAAKELQVDGKAVTISAGIAQYRADEKARDFIQRTENLMQDARRYRNKVVVDA